MQAHCMRPARHPLHFFRTYSEIILTMTRCEEVRPTKMLNFSCPIPALATSYPWFLFRLMTVLVNIHDTRLGEPIDENAASKNSMARTGYLPWKQSEVLAMPFVYTSSGEENEKHRFNRVRLSKQR